MGLVWITLAPLSARIQRWCHDPVPPCEVPKVSRLSGRAQSSARARAFALDPRLAIGIVLVVASVAGVVSLVAASDDSIEVYAAASTLTPGDRVTDRDLILRNVKLNESSDLYIVRGDLPNEGFIATRPIAKGELIPTSSLGSHQGISLTAVVIVPQGSISATVDTGASVDVWASAEADDGSFAAPGVIIAGAIVQRVLEEDSFVASSSGGAVEVLVPRSRVARLLEAIANGNIISVIPSNLPARG